MDRRPAELRCGWLGAALWLAAILFLHGCGRNDPQEGYRPEFGKQSHAKTQVGKTYLFGVHPLHNPDRLFQVYGPLVDLLNTRIPEAHFALEASRDYDEYDRKLYNRHFDLALPNPFQTLNSLRHGYRVFGKMGDDAMFRGIFIVRRDSGIRAIGDLKGKAVSFPAKSALAATMMPQYFLYRNGLPPSAYETHYVGSQESSIMNVYLGNTAVGATWPPPWISFEKEHGEIARQLKVQWTTEPLVNNGLVARDDFPPVLLEKVAAVLFSLHDSPEGQATLARIPLSRFEAANDATYDPVRDFIQKFSSTVRPVTP
jgi:phosphonate transport system substrate-binding protein